MTHFFVFVICVFSIFPIHGQGSNFDEIIAELDITVKEKGNAEIEEAWELVKPRMISLEVEQKSELSSLFDSMKASRLSLNPYYLQFFKAYSKTFQPNLPEDTYNQWISVIQQMLAPEQKNKANKLKAFLEFSVQYFDDNTIRASKGGTNWKISDYHDAIEFEDDKPFFVFNDVNLSAFIKKDTMQIFNASGKFQPLSNTWIGISGIARWDEGPLGPIQVTFDDYTVDTRKGIYTVENVSLEFNKFFGETIIEGSFEDKLSSEANSIHPKFVSFGKNLVLNDIAPNLSLRGGIELRGNRLFSTGNTEKKAEMLLRDGTGKIKFRLGSTAFAVKEAKEISGKRMTLTLFLDQDSIYHPSVNTKYNIDDNTLTILRGETALDAVPFYDSYHNFNIQVDEIKWYIGQDSLIYGEKKKGITSDIKTLFFESPDYYSSREFNRIQSIADVNPIIILKIMSDKSGSNVHAALDVAKRINPRYNLGSVQTLFFDLVSSGFINYDKENEMIEVRDKVFHYADASRNRIDYDRLKITSKTSENNAIVNSKSNEMIVSNVKGVELSPIHKVALVPSNKKLRILRNRSMKVDGYMFAGLTTFEGKGFHFNYDQYSAELDSVKYFDFFIPPDDGSSEPVGLSSRLENGSGTLLIDAPGNKSAQEHIPLFPSFSSARPFSIFYDRAQDSVYDRSSFYFQLDQFGFNTLDSFSRSDVQFKGKLYSDNIFEPFEETVTIQDDYSLGFTSSTGEAGKDIYGGKGKLIGDIRLTNNGLEGEGEIQYLSSVFQSEDLLFLPKALKATSKDFNVSESSVPVEFPQVSAALVNMTWNPYSDSLIVANQDTPFSIFDQEQAELDGTLVISPKGINGKGALSFDQGKLVSNLFNFSTKSVLADTSDLFINAIEGDELAFETRNVSGEIDFREQKARFQANSSEISTNMPYNQYKTSMNAFVWDIPKKEVSFTAKGDQDAYFLSTDSNQDSLIFAGKTAKYNIANSTLEVGGVTEMEVGDALIALSDKAVAIEPGGKMQRLDNATIYLDKDAKQHEIKSASVEILGKQTFSANGQYAYDLNGKSQRVTLNNIVCKPLGKGQKSEKNSITKATGEILETDDFYIDAKTKFSGSMSLSGDSRDLLFKGFAQLDAPLLPQASWFSINSLGDKENLIINYEVPKNKNGAPIRTGIFLSKENATAYPSVMNPLSFRKDRPVIDTKGQFKYDESEKTFVFGDSLKIRGQALKGNILKYNNETAEVFAQGIMQLCPKIQPFIPLKTVGNIITKYKTKTADQRWSDIPEPVVKAEVMSSLKIPLPKAMIDQMAVDFRSSTFDATKPKYANDDFYKYALVEFTNKTSQYEESLKYLEENVIEIPRAADKSTLVLGKMEMKWDPDYQSFVSKPGKVPLVSMDGSPINIMIDVHVEYKMTTNEDDRLYIYLKSPSGLFYFFGFQGGVLNVTSDNSRFMGPLNDMKDKDRIIEISKELSFELQGVTEGTANKFIQRSKAAW